MKRRFWSASGVPLPPRNDERRKPRPKPIEVETPCCGGYVTIFRYGKGTTKSKHKVTCCNVNWKVTYIPLLEAADWEEPSLGNL